jgi:hypothetical protein
MAILLCVKNSGKKNQATRKVSPEVLSVGYKFYNLRIDYKLFVMSLGFLNSSTFLQSSNDLGLKNLSLSIPNPN